MMVAIPFSSRYIRLHAFIACGSLLPAAYYGWRAGLGGPFAAIHATACVAFIGAAVAGAVTGIVARRTIALRIDETGTLVRHSPFRSWRRRVPGTITPSPDGASWIVRAGTDELRIPAWKYRLDDLGIAGP